MEYKIINTDKWERGKIFKYYIEKLPNVMSLTVDIDITEFLEFIKNKKLKFYPSMIWLVSKVLNSHDEFKYNWDKKGNLIKWDYISPYYADFNKEDQTFVRLVTEYNDNLKIFHYKFMENREKFKNLRGFDLKDIPLNTYDLSCLPWVRYKSFDLHVFDDGKYLAPGIVWGKYEKQGDRYIMPLTMTAHHAVCDGFHLCRFFNEIQGLINKLESSKNVGR